jgi:Uma2 family endonuclease
MSAPVRHHRYSFADYLAVEEMSVVKHEFLDGSIYAMAGGSPMHAALSAAAVVSLSACVKGGRCRVFSSDLRIRVLETGLASYPDVSVVCGPPAPDPESADTVTNPTVVVEVLSESTMDYDLGEKFEHYRRIPSLKAVVYLWQRERRIEVRQRSADDTWAVAGALAGDVARIDAIQCAVAVDDIYSAAELPRS